MDLLLGKKPAREQGQGQAQPAGAGPIRDATTATFEREVIAASMQVPVIVDFWAPWCGPCKQLGPILERAVTATAGKVRMVKVNIDESPEIAQALRIQSIPTVYAFHRGQPVDGFMGAVPESQIRQFVDKLVKAGANSGLDAAGQVEAMLEEAKQAALDGQPQVAQAIYSEILEADPASAIARAGLARLMLEHGQAKMARQVLDAAPAEAAKHAELVAVRTAVELAEQGSKAGGSAKLALAVEANPDDHQARLDLALAHYAEGNREAAVDALLDSIRRDRAWNEEAARKQLIKFFEAFGPTDPLTVSARKRLSSLLFR